MKVLLVVLLFAVPALGQHRIESKYDRFTDKTTVTARFFHPVTGKQNVSVNLEVRYEYQGSADRIAPPSIIVFRFVVTGEFRLDRDSPFYVVADKKRYRFDNVGGFRFEIPFADLESILKSRNIETRVGTLEMSFSESDWTGIKECLPQPAN